MTIPSPTAIEVKLTEADFNSRRFNRDVVHFNGGRVFFGWGSPTAVMAGEELEFAYGQSLRLGTTPSRRYGHHDHTFGESLFALDPLQLRLCLSG